MKNPLKIGLFAFFAIALLGLGQLSPLHFSQFELLSHKGVEPASFPLNVSSTGEHDYLLRGHLQLDYFVPSLMQIIPDDRLIALQINGTLVNLNDIPHHKLSNYRTGFVVDLASVLHRGDNLVEFHYSDRGGRMGMNMQLPTGNGFSLFLHISWALWLTLLLYQFRKKLGFTTPVVIVVGLAFALRILYLMITGFDTRPHDVWAHLSYIEHFTRTFALPDLRSATDGAYFHPPLYYFLASFVHRLASWLSSGEVPQILYALQVFSLAFSLGFVVLAARTVLLAFQVLEIGQGIFKRLVTLSTLAVVVFWPSGILHSVRIGNDPQLYFLLALGAYLLLSWYHKPTRGKYIGAMIITALAIITKANGAILAVAGLLTLIAAFGKHSPKIDAKSVRWGIPWMAAVLVAIGVAFYPGLALKMSGERTHLYVSNIDRVSVANQVGNHAGNYFWFDVQTFLTKPWTDPFDDSMGRQYFWNYMAKTGLFGEWQYTPVLANEIAVVLSFLFLLLFAGALWGIGNARGKDFWAASPLTWVGVLLLMGVTYMRITFPVNIDFRYILPVIIPFGITTGYAILRLQEKGHTRLAVFGLLVQLLFIKGSAVFLLSLT